MFRAWHDRARPLTTITSVLAALLLLMISLGMGATASADPGNGKGSGQADGQAASTPAAPASPAPTTTASTTTKPAGSQATKASKPAKASGGAASSHQTSGTSGTSGDVTQPQPKSNADQNTGGANGDCGSYCSTRDGAPSKNGDPKGTGGGMAAGKPCAGCVGKADNKNPPGQYQDGSDHNAGYECDRNQGIGKTNPAHTGCTTSSTPECQPQPGQNPDCSTQPGCEPQPGQNPDCSTPGCVVTPSNTCGTPGCVVTPTNTCGTPGCVVTPTNTCSQPDCVEADAVTCDEGGVCAPTDEVPCSDEELCVPGESTTCAFDNLGEEASRGPVANAGTEVVAGTEANLGIEANRAPAVLGTEASRPAAGALPNTGASGRLSLLAATGLGLLLVGGATLAVRRVDSRG
jgi:hypothetical protein